MTFLDLFSGIGGFRIGMELAGHECVGFCEQDKFAAASYISMHCISEEQREYLSTLNLKQRREEILKDVYRNGEWYAEDIRRLDAGDMPRADCWCFGFPCQDISIAGRGLGFDGERSSLFFTVTGLIRKLKAKDRPKYLLAENVKNLLSISGGRDFLKVLIELDEIGYDVEWDVLNSKNFGVPQNRERIFIVGHLRNASTTEIFPITGSSGENSIQQIGQYDSERGNANAYRVYDPDGICPSLNTAQGGAECPISFIDLTYNIGVSMTENARAIQARYNKGVSNHIGEVSGVAIKVKEATKQGYAIAHEGDSINLAMPNSKTRRGRVGGGVAQTLDTSCNQGTIVRISDNSSVYAVWSEEHQCYFAIRRLTPRECFRLQGWDDEYFERAQFVNSDTQLYKQAGNGVTVPVVRAIAERMMYE